MTIKQLFGTDGIRGQAGIYPITPELMLSLGKALTHWVLLKNPDDKPQIIISKDTRLSGYALEHALAAGLCAMGADVKFTGPLPTPALAFLTKKLKASAGVMISASHNSFEDNGIKLFGPDGFKLSDQTEIELENLILNIPLFYPICNQIGQASRINNSSGLYIEHLKSLLPEKFNLNGLRIVLDCAHGAAYKVGPQLLRELGAEVFTIGASPNGLNINKDFGSVSPDAAKARVLETKANLGIVLDGDADRLVLIDESGEAVHGDALLAILAIYLGEKNIVSTEMSSLALDRCLFEQNITITRAPVGDRYVVEKLRQSNLKFGGEESGHLIFLDHATTGDGLLGALFALLALNKLEKPLSVAKQIYKPIPRALENRKISKKISLDKLKNSSALIKQIEKELGDSGRVFVRYSGTEPKIRVLIESDSQINANKYASQIADSLDQELRSS